jgi:hypothetical protein
LSKIATHQVSACPFNLLEKSAAPVAPVARRAHPAKVEAIRAVLPVISEENLAQELYEMIERSRSSVRYSDGNLNTISQALSDFRQKLILLLDPKLATTVQGNLRAGSEIIRKMVLVCLYSMRHDERFDMFSEADFLQLMEAVRGFCKRLATQKDSAQGGVTDLEDALGLGEESTDPYYEDIILATDDNGKYIFQISKAIADKFPTISLDTEGEYEVCKGLASGAIDTVVDRNIWFVQQLLWK